MRKGVLRPDRGTPAFNITPANNPAGTCIAAVGIAPFAPGIVGEPAARHHSPALVGDHRDRTQMIQHKIEPGRYLSAAAFRHRMQRKAVLL